MGKASNSSSILLTLLTIDIGAMLAGFLVISLTKECGYNANDACIAGKPAIGFLIAGLGFVGLLITPLAMMMVEVPAIKKSVGESSYSENKWKVLKEVDPEIRAAVQKVIEVDEKLERVLADKFLAVGNKDYLAELVKNITEAGVEEKRQELSVAQEKEQRIAEENIISSRAEEGEYRKIIKENGYDYRYAARAVSIEAYSGSRGNFHGGICVKFDDGSTLLIKGKESDIFRKGDGSWM